MKKGLTFILTFILSFICITSYVNAEDGLSCTFLYDTTNENSDKSSITLPINFYGDNYLGNFKMTVKGKSINRYSNDGNLDVSNYPYVEKNGTRYYIAYSDGFNAAQSFGTNDDGNVKWDCSLIKIYTRESERKNTSGNKVKVLILSSNLSDGKLLIDKSTTEINSGSTTFKGGFDLCALNSIGDTKSAEQCRTKGKQQSNIIINKDVNGNWYVSIDGNKSLVDENASGNYVWTGNGNLSYKKGFAITKEDWESLKSAIENNAKDIYVTAKDNKFLITASPVSGGDAASIKVSTNYSVSGDNSYAWNNGKPSTSIGACVNYLGSASTENTPAYYLNKAFFIMKIVSILGVILFSMLDFASQITANKDNLIPTAKKCGRRLIIVILLLLLPTFIDMIGNIIGQQDILCGIK